MPFFNNGTECIFIADFGEADNGFGVQKHPVVAVPIAIGFAVHRGSGPDNSRMFPRPGWRPFQNGQGSFSGPRAEAAPRPGVEPKSVAADLRVCGRLQADEPESGWARALAETKSETARRRPRPIPRHLYRCPCWSWRELKHRCDVAFCNARSMVHR